MAKQHKKQDKAGLTGSGSPVETAKAVRVELQKLFNLAQPGTV